MRWKKLQFYFSELDIISYNFHNHFKDLRICGILAAQSKREEKYKIQSLTLIHAMDQAPCIEPEPYLN